MSTRDRPRRYRLGKRVQDQDRSEASKRGSGPREFFLHEDDLMTHVAMLGRTGSGKSRGQRQLINELIDQGHGVAVFEPGDLVEDLLGDIGKRVIETGSTKILERVHLLENSPYRCFGYDLFRMPMLHAIPHDFRGNVQVCWQHTKVQNVGEIAQALQGKDSFETQVRKQRVMTTALKCCACVVDGKRLSPADMQVLLNPLNEDFPAIHRKLAPVLDDGTRSWLEFMSSLRRPQDIRQETESTQNGWNALVSPLVAASMSCRPTEPSIDFANIVQQSGIVLVPLRESQLSPHSANIGLATLLLYDLIETMIVTPRELRKPFTIFIDEAGELLMPRLIRWLGMLRKYLCRLVISGQDLSTFRKSEDFDLAPKLLSQCGTLICFQQRWPDDLNKLNRILGTGNLDFTPLTQEVERSNMVWIQLDEMSESMNAGIGKSISDGTQATTTITHQEGNAAAEAVGDGTADSSQRAVGGVDSRSRPEFNADPRRSQISHADSEVNAAATSKTHNLTKTNTKNVSDAVAKASGTNHAEQDSQNFGVALTIAHKLMLVNMPFREKVKTGKLEQAVTDQLERIGQWIQGLRKQHAIALTPGSTQAFEFRVADVPDAFRSPEALVKTVEWVKRQLWNIHPYWFVPDLSPEASRKRIDWFLGRGVDMERPVAESKRHSDTETDQQENKPEISPTTVNRKAEKSPFAF